MPEQGGVDRLLATTEAARALGVHANTLRTWADKGLVPFVRLPSGVRRFSQSQLARIKAEMYGTDKGASSEQIRPAAA